MLTLTARNPDVMIWNRLDTFFCICWRALYLGADWRFKRKWHKWSWSLTTKCVFHLRANLMHWFHRIFTSRKRSKDIRNNSSITSNTFVDWNSKSDQTILGCVNYSVTCLKACPRKRTSCSIGSRNKNGKTYWRIVTVTDDIATTTTTKTTWKTTFPNRKLLNLFLYM